MITILDDLINFDILFRYLYIMIRNLLANGVVCKIYFFVPH